MLVAPLAGCVSAPERDPGEDRRIVEERELAVPAPLSRPGACGSLDIARLAADLDSADDTRFSFAKARLRLCGQDGLAAWDWALPASTRGKAAVLELAAMQLSGGHANILDANERLRRDLTAIVETAPKQPTAEQTSLRVQAFGVLTALSKSNETDFIASRVRDAQPELRWCAAGYFRTHPERMTVAALGTLADALNDDNESVRIDAGLLLGALWTALTPDEQRVQKTMPPFSPLAPASVRADDADQWRQWANKEAEALLRMATARAERRSGDGEAPKK